MRRQPLRINSNYPCARMASNAAVVESAKSSATGSPAPAQEANNNAGTAEVAGGDKKVKTEKECTLSRALAFMLFMDYGYPT